MRLQFPVLLIPLGIVCHTFTITSLAGDTSDELDQYEWFFSLLGDRYSRISSYSFEIDYYHKWRPPHGIKERGGIQPPARRDAHFKFSEGASDYKYYQRGVHSENDSQISFEVAFNGEVRVQQASDDGTAYLSGLRRIEGSPNFMQLPSALFFPDLFTDELKSRYNLTTDDNGNVILNDRFTLTTLAESNINGTDCYVISAEYADSTGRQITANAYYTKDLCPYGYENYSGDTLVSACRVEETKTFEDASGGSITLPSRVVDEGYVDGNVEDIFSDTVMEIDTRSFRLNTEIPDAQFEVRIDPGYFVYDTDIDMLLRKPGVFEAPELLARDLTDLGNPARPASDRAPDKYVAGPATGLDTTKAAGARAAFSPGRRLYVIAVALIAIGMLFLTSLILLKIRARKR